MAGIEINWGCPLPKCTWAVPPAVPRDNRAALAMFVGHLRETHGIPRNGGAMIDSYDSKTRGYKVDNGVPISILARVEMELDKYIKIAMEWPDVKGGLWDNNEMNKLYDELEKAKASAAGRGLAIALWHMHGEKSVSNRFTSPDHVIRDAVERYKNPVPEDSHMGISPSQQAAAAPVVEKKAPIAKLTEEQRARIKDALDGGFDAAALVSMFKVPLAEIEACR